MRRLKLGCTGRVWIYNATLASLAAALAVTVVPGLDQLARPHRLSWWALAAMFFLTESAVVHINLRREAFTYSLSEIPLVLGLFLGTPVALIVGRLAGSAAALIARRRQSPVKAVFNLSQFTVETCIAAAVFTAAVGPDPLAARGWAAALATTLVCVLVTNLSIAAVMSLAEGRARLQTLTYGLGFGAVVAATNTSVALMIVSMVWERPYAAFLTVIPAATLLGAYRAYVAQRRQHERLGLLFEATREVNRSHRVEPTLLQLLTQARSMFHAEMAQIVLLPDWGDGSPLRVRVGPEGRRIERLAATETLEAVASTSRRARLLPPGADDPVLNGHLAERGVRDAMVVPILREASVVGTMLVANRIGDVETFEPDDLTLFETLANHASVALEKAHLFSRLEQSLAHMTELHRLKDDFVATVSHELRTPLTGIQGFVKTMLRRNEEFRPAQHRAMLEVIERQGDRLARLIEDLLLTSKIQSQEVSIRVRPFSMTALVRQLAEEFYTAAPDRTIAVETEQELLVVRNDEGKIHQILANLVGNAIKYSPPGSTVTIRSGLGGGGAYVSVDDQGPGIPEHLRDRIFDRFYQIDQSSTRLVGGVGLGLYICRRLAEALGGHVFLDRSDTTGSTFTLRVPLEIEAAGAPREIVVDPGEERRILAAG